PGQRNRMSNPADAVQPGFIKPFANAFWSWKGYVPNETKLSPYSVGNAKGGQWWNLAGEFECASLGPFAYVGTAPALNRTVYDLMRRPQASCNGPQRFAGLERS